MTTEKIKNAEIAALRVSSLPSRPNASGAFGGRGYTAAEMKEAFDRLPLFLIERFNSLLDDIAASGDGSLADTVPTGLGEGHTLADLFSDIGSGALAGYLSTGEEKLSARLDRIDGEIDDATSYEHVKKMPSGVPGFPTLADFLAGVRNGALSEVLVTSSGILGPIMKGMRENIAALQTTLREKSIRTGITETHTLADMFGDIKSGAFADYLVTDGGKLEERLAKIEGDLTSAKSEASDKIDEVKATTLTGSTETGIKENYTVSDFFSDVKSGDILTVIPCGGVNLSTKLYGIDDKIAKVEENAFSPSAYKTGLTEEQTLDAFFTSLIDSTFFETVYFGTSTLGTYLRNLLSWQTDLTSGQIRLCIDCGRPSDRPDRL